MWTIYLLRMSTSVYRWYDFMHEQPSSPIFNIEQGKSKLDDLTSKCLEECAQLVKENSIEGCKRARVNIVYTKWKNLKKVSRASNATVIR